MRIAQPLLILLLLAGCKGSAPSLAGKWSLPMGPSTMQIEFGGNGMYTGTINGATGAGQVSGGYSVKGNYLEMQPPTISGPNGGTTPPGGVMKVKMSSQGPDMILLDAGDKKFTMTRVSPGS